MRAVRKPGTASLLLPLAAIFLLSGQLRDSVANALQDSIGTELLPRQERARKPLELTVTARKRRGHDDSFLGKAPRVPYVAFRRDGSVLDWRGSFPTAGLPEQRIATVGTASYKGKASATTIGSQTSRLTVVGDSTIVADFTPGGGTVTGTVTNIALDGTSQPTLDPSRDAQPIRGSFSAFKFSGDTNPAEGPSSSEYQGAFYGSDASETAGTFQFGAPGTELGIGIGTIHGVGSFGASR